MSSRYRIRVLQLLLLSPCTLGLLGDEEFEVVWVPLEERQPGYVCICTPVNGQETEITTRDLPPNVLVEVLSQTIDSVLLLARLYKSVGW